MSTPFGKLIKTDKSYENLNIVFEHGSIRYIEHEVYDYDHHDCIFGCFDNKPDEYTITLNYLKQQRGITYLDW